MKKFWKGVLAFGPLGTMVTGIGCLILSYIGLFLMAVYVSMTGADPAEITYSLFVFLLIIIFFACIIFLFSSILLSLLDMIVFCIHACKNPNLDEGKKVLWCILFILFQLFTYPVYWCIHMRKEANPVKN